MIDLTTYALLRKQIATAASGISDVRAEGDELVFVLVDGHEVRVAIPATEIRDAVVRDDMLVLTLEDDKEVVVDATLTQSGQAADAKATGDAIGRIKDDMTAKADKAALAQTDRSLDALWKLNQDISYNFETDAAAAYAKQVPSGAKLADVQSVGGKTVVWNQYDKDNWVSYAPANIPTGSVEKNGREYTYTIITLGNDEFTNTIRQDASVISGHKYYQSFQIKSNKAFDISYSGVNDSWYTLSYTQANVYKYYRIIQTAATPKSIFIGYKYASSNGLVVGDSFSVKDIILIDLTQLFGSGNEPTDISDSRIAWIEQYAAAHPEYNAGELLSADVESVKYNDAIVAAIPSTARDLPGYGWSAGSVYNSIERTESGWQYIQRVGSVDLGSLNWSKRTSNNGVYSFFETIIGSINDMKVYSNNEKWNSLIMPKYDIGIAYQIYHGTSENLSYAGWDGRGIRVRDDAYTDAGTFKSALAGVMLYYELAEPIITDITEDMLEPFDVEGGGAITFENNAKLPVPSSVEYIVSLAEVGA